MKVTSCSEANLGDNSTLRFQPIGLGVERVHCQDHPKGMGVETIHCLRMASASIALKRL